MSTNYSRAAFDLATRRIASLWQGAQHKLTDREAAQAEAWMDELASLLSIAHSEALREDIMRTPIADMLEANRVQSVTAIAAYLTAQHTTISLTKSTPTTYQSGTGTPNRPTYVIGALRSNNLQWAIRYLSISASK